MTELAGFEVLIETEGGRVDWGPGDLLAYSSIQNLDPAGGEGLASEIWTMRADGSRKRCLTGLAQEIPHLSNDQPAWHPSGDLLLFQSADPNLRHPGISDDDYAHFVQGGFGYNNNLWVMDADGQGYWQLTQCQSGEGTLHPHFSPDGTQVFWSAHEPKKSGGNGWVLKVADFVYDSLGSPSLGNIRTLAPLGEPSGDQCYEAHAMSNSGNRLLYSYSPGLPLDLDIWQTFLTDGESTNLTNAPGVWDEHAHWSADMSTIAWVSSQGYPFAPSDHWQQDLRTDVWLMNRDGSEKRQLTRFNNPGYAICADLAWSEDGQHLVLCRTEVTREYGSRQQVLRLDLA